jgi:hypothetical protein
MVQTVILKMMKMSHAMAMKVLRMVQMIVLMIRSRSLSRKSQ